MEYQLTFVLKVIVAKASWGDVYLYTLLKRILGTF